MLFGILRYVVDSKSRNKNVNQRTTFIPDLRGYYLSDLFFSAVALHDDHEFKRALKVSTSHLHQIEGSIEYCAF